MDLASKPLQKEAPYARSYARPLCADTILLILPPPSSLPRLPPPSSFYQPNPMLQIIRAVNSMALGFRPLPPPSSLLPSTPKTNPLCAALCAPPMRGTRLSIDLDRAPCLETSPPTRKLCASPYARDTIFNGFRSCTLLRNHHKKMDPMRKPYAPDMIFNGFRSRTLLRS